MISQSISSECCSIFKVRPLFPFRVTALLYYHFPSAKSTGFLHFLKEKSKKMLPRAEEHKIWFKRSICLKGRKANAAAAGEIIPHENVGGGEQNQTAEEIRHRRCGRQQQRIHQRKHQHPSGRQHTASLRGRGGSAKTHGCYALQGPMPKVG